MYHKILEFYPKQRPKTCPEGESKAWSPDRAEEGFPPSASRNSLCLFTKPSEWNTVIQIGHSREENVSKECQKLGSGLQWILRVTEHDLLLLKVTVSLQSCWCSISSHPHLVKPGWVPSWAINQLQTSYLLFEYRNHETETTLSQWNYGYLNQSKTCTLTYPLCMYHL